MKYKIKFKGLDENSHDLLWKKIVTFLNEEYKDYIHQAKPIPKGLDIGERIFIWIDEEGEYEITAYLKEMTIGKYITDDLEVLPIPFNNKELQFFDKLGFELGDEHTDAVEQEIGDWF